MGQNLDDVLHVGTTEVHGTTVDVVKNQFHVVTLRRGGTNFHFERECHMTSRCYLDQGKEDGDDIVTAPLKVDQKRAEERGNRTQDKTMCPEVGVLGKINYQPSEDAFCVSHLTVFFPALKRTFLPYTFCSTWRHKVPCRQLWHRRTFQLQMPQRSRGAQMWSAPHFWSFWRSFSFSEEMLPQKPASEIWKVSMLRIGVECLTFYVENKRGWFVQLPVSNWALIHRYLHKARCELWMIIHTIIWR